MPDLPFRRILHIEDSETDAYIVKRAFRESPGVEVEQAATGQEGIEKALKGVDLILLDYALPDMTGIEVLLQLSERVPDTPIVLVSGFGSEYVAARALQLGAAGYVNKDAPHFREDLPGVLQRLVVEADARRRQRDVADKIRQRPTLRQNLEEVLQSLRQALPDARGTFITSHEGLPLAVSRSDGGRDVDVLAAMVCGSVLRNLDLVGGNLALDQAQEGYLRYRDGALLYRRLPEVGSLVAVFEAEATPVDELRELEAAARELQDLVRED